MKKSKSILALMLALLLTLTMFACAKKENNAGEAKEETKTEETTTEAKEEAPAEETKTESAAPQDALSIETKKAESLDAKYDNAYALLDTAVEENKAKYDSLYPNDPYKIDVEVSESDEANKKNYISLIDNIIAMDRLLAEATEEKPYDTNRNKGEKVLTYALNQEEGKDAIFYANRDLYNFLNLELEAGDKLKIKDWTKPTDEVINVVLGNGQKDRYELNKTYDINYFGRELKIMPIGVAKQGATYVNGRGEEINLDNAIIAPLNYADSKGIFSEEQYKELFDTAVVLSPEPDKAMYLGNYFLGAYKAVKLQDLVK